MIKVIPFLWLLKYDEIVTTPCFDSLAIRHCSYHKKGMEENQECTNEDYSVYTGSVILMELSL